MKYAALIAVAGSLTVVSAPVQAAELPGAPTHSLAQTSVWSAPLISTSHLGDPDWDDDDWDDDDDYRDRRRYRRGHGRYDRRGHYRNPPRLSRRDRVWRGRDGRYYCKRDNGTTGLVIGAGVGALLGRTIDTRGDRTVGTVLGALAGGLLGREIDRGELRCR